MKIYEKEGCVKIKIKEDLNGDGKFGEDELIQGKDPDVEDVDALINFEERSKSKNKCTAVIGKSRKPCKEIGTRLY